MPTDPSETEFLRKLISILEQEMNQISVALNGAQQTLEYVVENLDG